MTTKQISVFLENRPGTLLDFCRVLDAEQISMRAMCVAEAEDFGILRIIVDDAYTTATTLRDRGYICRLTDVLTIEIEDRPGALLAILEKLQEAGVNLEYSYAFLSKKTDKAYMVLRVTDPVKAQDALSGGIRIIGQDELSGIFND